jgi:hypothetical protein
MAFYCATCVSKNGRVLDTEFSTDEWLAARRLFGRNPNAKVMSISDAGPDPVTGVIRSFHKNIHWITKRQADAGSLLTN